MPESFHILVVDQDQHLCTSLAPLLSQTGCRVDCLSGNPNPFAAIRELSPDLVVLEISSTQVEGLETLRRLESRRTAQKIPVIVISRQAELEYELPDVFDFLPHPVDKHRLLEDVALVTGRQQKRGLTPYPALSDDDLNLFQNFLITHSGLHFDRRNSKILERGLMRRMRALNLSSFREYYRYLETYQESRQELKKLLALLTIGETYFFRYLAHFEALTKKILPEVIERNRSSRTLRIWSAGCSSGEEAYSIAMVLLEHFPFLADWQISILASDINKQSLRRAREGVYRPRSLRVTEARYRDHYFRQAGSAFLLDERVKKMVRFCYLNLQTGHYPSTETGTDNLDLLFCRNVLIYFRLATTKRMIERFGRCLRPGGYLFLGHAETLMNISNRFQRVQESGGFFYRLLPPGREAEPARPAPVETSSIPTPSRPAAPAARPSHLPLTPAKPPQPVPAPPSSVPAPKPETQPQEEVDLEEVFAQAEQAFHQENFKTASQKYAIILRHDPRHVGALLGQGFVQANHGELERALEFSAKALEVDDLSSEAYFLQGLIREMEENLAAAVNEYRKALLLTMDFIMPHYNLSKVYRKLGRSEEARRELRNTVRLLEKAPDESIVPFSGGLSRAVFLEICRDETAQMKMV